MIEFKGTLLGKRVLTYDDTKRCQFDELIKKYRKYDKVHLLRQFSDLSTALFKAKENIINLSDVPVDIDFVNYCMLTAINHCTGSKTDINSSELYEIIRISRPWYQNDLIFDKDNPFGYFVQIAYRQFVYQGSMSIISRSIYIYNYLWPQKYNSLFNINNEILKIYGLSYDKILFYGMALTGSQESYFYSSDFIGKFKTETSIDIQDGDFNKFIKLVSLDSDSFAGYKGSLLNPILKCPILLTDFYPNERKEPVNLILSKACLFNKLVYGLYYDLLESNMEVNGKNDFKTTFGYVFQDYIGVLLKAHFKKWNIVAEIEYKKGNTKIASVDWFIQRGDNIILIEVKQSSIFLPAKNSGNIENLKDNINKNIIKAIDQLEKSEKDITSKEHEELKMFNKAKNFQKLIIIADPLYFGNFIVNGLFDNILIKKRTHIINISDFESLIDLQKKHENLFYLLEAKMTGDNKHKDFTEFIFEKYGNCHTVNKFLIKNFDKYYKSWNINPLSKTHAEDK